MQKKISSEQQKEEFQLILSKLSHEIRNPLTLISSELQMMSASHPEVMLYQEWDNIMENLDYISELLNRISQYQSAERISPTNTDTTAWFLNIINTLRPALDYLGVTFKVDIPDSLPRLLLDQVKMRQAFLNLIQNAQESIQHSHGIIHLSVSASSNEICITLSDNGCGMTSRQLQDIFQPFVTYKPGGTGLGLAVTRQIIEAHHGNISVKSTPEHGTCFYITLPLPVSCSQYSSEAAARILPG